MKSRLFLLSMPGCLWLLVTGCGNALEIDRYEVELEDTGLSDGDTDVDTDSDADSDSDSETDTSLDEDSDTVPPICAERWTVATGDRPVIDDLEDGNTILPFREGRIGAWILSTDSIAEAVSSMAVENGGAEGSAKAIHFTGSNHYDWGARTEVKFGYCYDASVYTGIGFWMRGSSNTPLQMRIDTPDTLAIDEGGICLDNCRRYEATFDPPTDQWALYEIYWEDLVDASITPAPFDPTWITDLSFHADDSYGMTFDIWIDNIHFLEAQP